MTVKEVTLDLIDVRKLSKVGKEISEQDAASANGLCSEKIFPDGWERIELNADFTHPLLDGVKINAIPVLPDVWRDGRYFDDEGNAETEPCQTDWNALYRRINSLGGILLRNIKTDAPQSVTDSTRRMLQEALDKLFAAYVGEIAGELSPRNKATENAVEKRFFFGEKYLFSAYEYYGYLDAEIQERIENVFLYATCLKQSQ